MASTSGASGPENALQEMAPSGSAIVRSSKLIQKLSYDVFINHRGPDLKKTLATRIYGIFDNMKVPAFLDSEELKYGDFLPTTLEAAIHIRSSNPRCYASYCNFFREECKISFVFGGAVINAEK
ncbi:hypothetical protein SUGI_1125010 [Cryptomeria japonica]|nr:hypothetical protein SUGI_1125010 [Cryptomeria japonica]